MNKEATKVAPVAPIQQAKITTTNLKTSYCNMASTNTTREEVVLNFGINQNWDRGAENAEVSMEHRIILSPFLAKRLSQLLNKVVEEYEARHGTLS